MTSGSLVRQSCRRLLLLEVSALLVTVAGASMLWLSPEGIAVIVTAARSFVVALAIATGLFLANLYEPQMVRRPQAGTIGRGLAIGLAIGATAWLLVPDLRLPVPSCVAGLIAGGALLGILRVVFARLLRSNGRAERLLILGSGPVAERVVAEIQARPSAGYAVVGAVDVWSTQPRLVTHPLPGPTNRLHDLVEQFQPERIVIVNAREWIHLPTLELASDRMRGIMVEDALDAHERITGKLDLERLSPTNLILADGFAVSHAHTFFSRAVSLAMAALSLFVLAPLLGLIALIIKLEAPGPVLFKQMRIGLGGRPFPLFKFRTMTVVDHHTSEWERDNRERITRAGRWLRMLRLDEIPQFVNVLRGDMNLVGPRPHPLCNYQLFVEQIPYYGLRELVRPGITGWAQVRHGYANDLAEETEKMSYDLFYLKHRSLRLDLRILMETLNAVAREARSAWPNREPGQSAVRVPPVRSRV